MSDQTPRVVVITPKTHDGLGTLHPMGRMGETSDVVSAIMYLESAPFVTGEFMHVDGGQERRPLDRPGLPESSTPPARPFGTAVLGTLLVAAGHRHTHATTETRSRP
jgi:hypothetical protein